MSERRSALIVANDTYDDPKLRRLRSPAADALALAGVLRDPEIGGFEVEVLQNEPEATLRRKIADFFREGRMMDDVLLLHFSCHGVKDDFGALYFATPDTNLDRLDVTAVSAAFVRAQMDQSPSQRVVLLLDCCFSGAFGENALPKGGGSMDLAKRFTRPRGRGRAVLTASTAMEYSFEGDSVKGEGEPSLFTKALVTGLETGEAGKGEGEWISVDQLYLFARDYVQQRNPKQTPMRWMHSDDDIDIAHRRRSGVRLLHGGLIDYSALRDPFVLETLGGEAYSVAISPSGNAIAAATEGGVLLWRAETDIGQWCSDDVPMRREIGGGHDGFIYTVAFSPDGTLVASAGEDGVVRIVDIDGRELWSRQRHKEAVYSASFSPDGSLIATGSYDRTVRLSVVSSGALQRMITQRGRVSSVAFSPNRDDTTIAIGCLDNSIWLWDTTKGETREIGEHLSSVECLAFSRDGNWLASCGLDKSVRVWSVRARPPVQLWANKDEHEYLVRSVQFSPDGGTVASASWDKTIRFWNRSTGIPFQPPADDDWPTHTDWIWSVAFSSDGRAFASSGSDGQVIVFRIASS